ncbi:adenylate kinase 8-like [Synchiropus splendidus]|uniref:adenylate kinase 8-like n=1 Tax=Synchiropus splendidus TaxID=270530 RepID=UPI00237EB402|nr:adenylate kinase 8-like [Synchiropus splendidus]
MEETVRQISAYADKHNIRGVVQDMVTSLLVVQPDDPISFLVSHLKKKRVNAARVMLLGPPAVGKYTVARKLSVELGAVHVTPESLLDDLREPSHGLRNLTLMEQVGIIQHRLNQEDCISKGWILAGIPQTYLQARNLQQAGVLPDHVIMLDAPNDVLLERSRGRLIDRLTGEVYHQTFVHPPDDTVAQRLERMPHSSETQLLSEIQCFRCEITGLSAAFQHALRAINADQPPLDVYQQVLAFVQTHRCYRTPRILLLGPPGAGKSHQAQMLAEKYKMVDVSSGRMLRLVATGATHFALDIRPHVEQGRPVPDELVLQVINERLNQPDCSSRGWVLHGFPRDTEQLTMLQSTQHRPNLVFFLDLMDEVCLERTSLKLTDPVTGERIHFGTTATPTPPASTPATETLRTPTTLLFVTPTDSTPSDSTINITPAPESTTPNTEFLLTPPGQLPTSSTSMSQPQINLEIKPQEHTRVIRELLSMYRTHSAALQSAFPDAIHIDADQDPRFVFEALECRMTSN